MATKSHKPNTPMHHAYIGVGSNLGDSRQLVATALGAVSQWPDVNLVRVASLYQTAAIGQPGAPDYINTVAHLHVTCDAFTLMSRMLALESSMGRPVIARATPRLMDLDLLLFDRMVMRSELLMLPHPRMQERMFVLAPLAEIAPNVFIPGHGRAKQVLHHFQEEAGKSQRVDKLPDLVAISGTDLVCGA